MKAFDEEEYYKERDDRDNFSSGKGKLEIGEEE